MSKLIIELFRLQLTSVKSLGLGFKIYVALLTVSGCDFVRLVFSNNEFDFSCLVGSVPLEKVSKLEVLQNVKSVV
ncbi:MAG: hypothetical protein ACI9RO_000782 [Alteromonas macleodii]|jgi:hypothetical protein